MKKATINIVLFIASGIGAGFNLWFLFNRQLYSQELTQIGSVSILLNHGLFYISLILMLTTFFIKKEHFRFFGSFLIILGLLYLTLMLTFKQANYLYLIPLGFYSLTGYLLLGSEKKFHRR